ncbi:MAG: ABC transporter permease, partial [Firmicutes bacterium]|nr:ABC transporter permease [Bacillota bacterium]
MRGADATAYPEGMSRKGTPKGTPRKGASRTCTLWNAWSSEWIKYWRTYTWFLVLLVPVVWGTLVGWYLAVRHTPGWSAVFTWVFEAWSELFLPMGAALLAGLAASYEAQAGNWSVLRARPVAPGLLYTSKLLTLQAHALISTALAAAAAAVAGFALRSPGPVPWQPLALAVLLPWVAALPILALQLWVATAKGLG